MDNKLYYVTMFFRFRLFNDCDRKKEIKIGQNH